MVRWGKSWRRTRADNELSQMNRDTLPGSETAVGTLSGGQVTDLSCAPPPCISHKRGIAETWRNAFLVPIYRPTRTLLCILAILLIVIIGPPALICYIQVHSLKLIIGPHPGR